MPLTIHHLQNSQSERIPWLCEELNIPYELKLYQRSPLLCPPELANLHPMKAAPIIMDTTVSPSITLAESPAVIEWIVNKHGNGNMTLPPSHPDYAQYLYWYHFTQGTLQPGIGRQLTLAPFSIPPNDPRRQYIDAKFHNTLSFVNAHLSDSKNTWLAGSEFTIADIMMVFSFTTMRTFFPVDLSEYEGILKYLERVGGREAYQKAMAKADPQLDWKGLMKGPAPPLFEGIKKMMQSKA